MNLIKSIEEEKKLELQDALIEKITEKRQEVKPDSWYDIWWNN